jgi:hypothetical protein
MGIDAAPDSNDAGMFWRRLLHRWFVEYNPLYLISALSVLVGLTMVSRASNGPTLDGELEVPGLIAEVYAFAMIGGAWLLLRIGHRRPAVMLGLLAALYQGDLTLLIERAADLGAAGVLTSLVWLAAFAIKLVLLARIFRLRFSRSAFLVPIGGAIALLALPRLFGPLADGRAFVPWNAGVGGAIAFLVFAAALFTKREVECDDELDAWGQKVLERSLKTIWLMWGLLFVAHFCFMAMPRGATALAFFPLPLLFIARFARRELSVWIAAAISLVVFPGAREMFSLFSLSVAAVLVLRALRSPIHRESEAANARRAVLPYRIADADFEAEIEVEAPPPITTFAFVIAPRAELIRLLTGAFSSLYLAVFTLRWMHDAPFPAHVLALDVAFTVVLVLVAVLWKIRARALAVPLIATYAHAAIQARLLFTPTTSAGWGASAIGVGFVLLALSIGASYALRRVERIERVEREMS